MPINNDEQDDLAESIKILATDDERLKLFGQLFASDSARKILQLLLNEEMTAARISQRTDISLQLVKYHLQKLQDLGMVKISKTGKNSKSHNMKYYTAKRFSVVVVPPQLSEKTKSSRLLMHSFRHIYRIAGLGVATGISGIFSALQLQSSRPIQDPGSPVPLVEPEIAEELETTLQTTPQDTQQQDTSPDESMPQHDTPQITQDESMAEIEGASQEEATTTAISEKDSMATGDHDAVEMEQVNLDNKPYNTPVSREPAESSPSLETQDGLSDASPEVTETLGYTDSSVVFSFSSSSSSPFPELFLPLVAVTAVLGGLTIFYLVKYLKRS